MSDQPAYVQTADGIKMSLAGLYSGIIYDGCWTLEAAMARASDRLRWSRAFEIIAFPRMALIDSDRQAAAEAVRRMQIWQRSATEIERILADLDAGRIPAPPGDIEPPLVARFADMLVQMAPRMTGDLPADVQAQWQALVSDLRDHAQNTRQRAASAALTVEDLEASATSWQHIMEMEVEDQVGPPPAMQNIIHDGEQVLDCPECVTIPPMERRIIWTN